VTSSPAFSQYQSMLGCEAGSRLYDSVRELGSHKPQDNQK